MILYANVTPGGYGEAEGWFEVKNINNETMRVQFSPDEDIKNITTFTSDTVELEPDETKNVDFVIRVPEPGLYEGKVNALYSIDSTEDNVKNATIQVDIIVRAEQAEADSPLFNITSKIIAGLSNMYVTLTLVGIGVIVLITGIWVRRR